MMQRRSSRRRIIDSTSVPNNRRKERASIGNGNNRDTDTNHSQRCLSESRNTTEKITNENPLRKVSTKRNPLLQELEDQEETERMQDTKSDIQCINSENDNGIQTGQTDSEKLHKKLQELENMTQSDDSDVFESDNDSNTASENDKSISGECIQDSDVSKDFTETTEHVTDNNDKLKPYSTKIFIETRPKKQTPIYMFPSRTVRHPCLFPAIPEEIHRELVNKEYMLPSRSIDIDETYKSDKSRPRRTVMKNNETGTGCLIDSSSIQCKKVECTNDIHLHLQPSCSEQISNLCEENTNQENKDISEARLSNINSRKDSFSLELDDKVETNADNDVQCNFEKTNVQHGLETKDPFSIELEKTHSFTDTQDQVSGFMQELFGRLERRKLDSPLLDTISMNMEMATDSGEEETNEPIMSELSKEQQWDFEADAYANLMEGSDGSPRLLSVEEKWQIIFNEKTRAPIYAVGQYVDYLTQYVNGKSAAVKDKDRINPISYLLRKLKLDLKMSYDSFVEEFLKPGNNGMALLVKLLKSIQNAGTQQTGSANKTQLKNYKKTLTDEHDCLLCIKFALRIKSALANLMEINYGLETIAMSLLSSFTKSRGTAIEILTITLSAAEGFSRTLDSFTYIQLKIGEPVRFKSLVNMLNMDSLHNIIFKVSCMKFMNCLLDAATNLNVRVYLQHELETAGLDVTDMSKKTTGTGLEYDDLRYEMTEWIRKYVRVEDILSQKNQLSQKVEVQNQSVIEELERKIKILTLEKTTLEHQLQNTRTILHRANEELQQRIPSTDHGAQVNLLTANLKDVSCQCSVQTESERNSTAVHNYHLTEAWQNSTSYPDDDVTVSFDYRAEVEGIDEHGVVKVQHWLESQDEGQGGKNKNIVKSDSQRKFSGAYLVHKTEFPGNWKLVPKSIVQFPSRFPMHQCHQTNCDRCDIRNRPENVPILNNQDVQSTSYSLKQNNVCAEKKRQEVKSESSDSAIGGSGERWQTKDRRIALQPTEVTEAEILQDMIEPDDSASGCRENEPFPDYSVVSAKINHRQSFRSELSEVLREFEGSLNKYDTTNSISSVDNEYTGHFVTLGQV